MNAMNALSRDEIRLTERAHYMMQLSAYFSELVDRPGVRFAFTHRFSDTWYNQAYDLDWPSGTLEHLVRLISDICRERDRATCMYTSPASLPINLDEQLKKYGLVNFEDEAWMFLPVELWGLPQKPSRSMIKVVTVDNTNLDDFSFVYRNGLPGPEVEGYIAAVRDGLRYAPPGVDVRYLIAYIDGQPVGILSILTTLACSGIYAVATLPAFQRQGVARKLIEAAGAIAKANRSRYLFLQTVCGDDGEQAFGRIGFETLYVRRGYTTAEIAESIQHG